MTARNAARPPYTQGQKPHSNLRAAGWLLDAIERCGWLGVLLVAGLLAVLFLLGDAVALVAAAIQNTT